MVFPMPIFKSIVTFFNVCNLLFLRLTVLNKQTNKQTNKQRVCMVRTGAKTPLEQNYSFPRFFFFSKRVIKLDSSLQVESVMLKML